MTDNSARPLPAIMAGHYREHAFFYGARQWSKTVNYFLDKWAKNVTK